ncbi:hypothetical protein GEV33_009401 [Tenebrio molitor]|uniref:MOB kinase activator-like 2 n=1 Tax=Tenebrio molitor TaxID=7067 RepID=A0A8J6HFB9_TENMO|nr:hypothetical protein GEV33_009401 [Tenebrio molitor]
MMWLGRMVGKAKSDDTVRVLPLDTEQTITCFCRKARRKEKEGNESSSSSDSKLYLEATVLERKLPEMDMRLLVDLPAGLDYNEWLASHTMALFDHVNLVYGTVSEFCTQSGCPDMTGPGQRTYLWFDEKGKKTKVAAPQYIDYSLALVKVSWATRRRSSSTEERSEKRDESALVGVVPTGPENTSRAGANEFPSSFESIVRKIVRLLFHVVAHLYWAHFKEVLMLGLHAHLNLTFAHLTALQHRFSLIEPKETEVLKDLEIALRLTEDSSQEPANNNERGAETSTEAEGKTLDDTSK